MERIQQFLLCLSIPSVVTNVIKMGELGDHNDALKYCNNEESLFLKWNDLSNSVIIAEIRRLTKEKKTNYVYFWIHNCQYDNGTWIVSSNNNCINGYVGFNVRPSRKLRKSCEQYDCGLTLHSLCKTKDRATSKPTTKLREKQTTTSFNTRLKINTTSSRYSTTSRLKTSLAVIRGSSRISTKSIQTKGNNELYPDSTQPTGASTNDKNSTPHQENEKNTEQAHFSLATISLALVLVILLCVVAVLCQKYKTKKDKGNDRNLGTQGMDERILNEDTETEAGAVCSKNTEYAEAVDDGIYSKAFSEQQHNKSPRDSRKEEPAYDQIASYYRNVASVLIENDTCRYNHSRSLAINENCYYNTTLKR